MTRTAIRLAAVALGLAAAPIAFAQDSAAAVGVSREAVLDTATNLAGEAITFPTGAAHMTAEMVTFEPGGHTALHQHPVPSFVYVLEGELEVRIEGQEPMRFGPGQAFMEPQDSTMQAFNLAEGPTRLLVVYSGAEGHENMMATQ